MVAAPHPTPEAAAAHGAAAFPPFDATLFPSQLLWFAITFGALYYVVSRFVLPSVTAVVEKRAMVVKDDLDLAALESEAAERTRIEAERVSAQARADARAHVEEMRAKAQAELAAEQAKAEEELARKGAAEEARIVEARDKALAQVDAIANELAGAIVAQLAGARGKVRQAQKVRA
jgi:F-type H+-transporting ATPase subunit b